MKLNFRHGLVRYHRDIYGQPAYLFRNSPSGDITLLATITPFVISFSHGNAEYLFQESLDVVNAWNITWVANQDYWLYIDLDVTTGERTFGQTSILPVTGNTAPVNPQIDQHWFDFTNNVMKLWNGIAWIEKIRVFVAKYDNATTFVYNLFGSTVGVNIAYHSGFILFDDDNKPLKKFDKFNRGKFITTETALSSQLHRSSSYKLESSIPVSRSRDNLLPGHVVCLTDASEVGICSAHAPEKPAIGLCMETVYSGEMVTYVTSGHATHVSWSWTNPPGTKVFVDEFGFLTTTVPSISSFQEIGYIVDEKTIYVDIRPIVLLVTEKTLTQTAAFIDRVTGNTVLIGANPNPQIKNVYGYSFMQVTPILVWNIAHNGGSENIHAQIFTPTKEVLLPDKINVIDSNNISIEFLTPQAGKAQILIIAS